MLGCALSGIYSPDRRLGKVKDEKTGENLLKDEVRLLGMKMDEANGVFQAAEGSLDPLTHGVEAFQGGGKRFGSRLVMRSSVSLFSVLIQTIRKERAEKSVLPGSKSSKVIWGGTR